MRRSCADTDPTRSDPVQQEHRRDREQDQGERGSSTARGATDDDALWCMAINQPVRGEGGRGDLAMAEQGLGFRGGGGICWREVLERAKPYIHALTPHAHSLTQLPSFVFVFVLVFTPSLSPSLPPFFVSLHFLLLSSSSTTSWTRAILMENM